jgi:hypothetical protein
VTELFGLRDCSRDGNGSKLRPVSWTEILDRAEIFDESVTGSFFPFLPPLLECVPNTE